MKKVFFFEHAQHIEIFLKEYRSGDIVIAWNPSASYALDINNVPYLTPTSFYTQKDLQSIYHDLSFKIVSIMHLLEEALYTVDQKFKANKIFPFFWKTYEYKIMVETIIYYIFVIKRVTQQLSPDSLVVFKNNVAIDSGENLTFEMNHSLLWYILQEFSMIIHTLKVEAINCHKENLLKTIARPWYKRWQAFSYTSSPSGTLNILSVSCSNLDIYKNEFLKNNINLHTHSPTHSFGKYKYYKKLNQYCHHSPDLEQICVYEGISFFNLFLIRNKKYLYHLDSVFTAYQKIEYTLKKNNYALIATHTLSPFEMDNILIQKAAEKLHIPTLCWMHGGFGANKSFEGYDFTDLMFSEHYAVYGELIAKSIKDNPLRSRIGDSTSAFIAEYFSQRNVLKLSILGASTIENKYATYERPNNSKPKIIFIMGELWYHNFYYLGGNTPDTFFQKWNEVKAILKLLSGFVEQYDICVKMYPGDKDGTHRIKSYLNSINAHSIQVIRNEKGITPLLFKADVIVSTWVSTTFFEAMLTDADQFLFDNSDLTQEAQEVLHKSTFFSSEIQPFCEMLNRYLINQTLYISDKKEFKEYFMDFNNSQNRFSHVLNTINHLISRESHATKI